MKSFDVVIIGAGPAGAILGYMLQKANISVCIIEKATFPRDKLCGGLMTEKSAEFLEALFNEDFTFYKTKTSKVNMYVGFEKMSSVNTNSNFFFVERLYFDQYLINKYKSAGGIVFENCQANEIDLKRNMLKTTNNQSINFKIVVGADGANSKTRKLIAPDYKPSGFCMEAGFANEELRNEIDIYFLTFNKGYGWIFPHNIGIGGVLSKNADIRNKFEKFVLNTIRDGSKLSTKKGAFIPFGKYIKNPGKGRVILIGDAAGLADPITGEGLFFAFKSAEMAMKAIISTQRNEYAGVDVVYKENIRFIHKIIDDANFFRIYFLKRMFLGLIKGKRNIVQYVCENLLSHYNVSYKKFPIEYLKIRKERKRNEKKDNK